MSKKQSVRSTTSTEEQVQGDVIALFNYGEYNNPISDTWDSPYTKEEARRRVEESIRQIEAGMFYTNDEVFRRMNERIERRCKE